MTFPLASPSLRLGMIGMTEGNGHPFSWSIILNGRYDPEALALCPFPAIRDYIAKQPLHTLGIEGAEVTHVWCDDPQDAASVAAVAGIAHVVAHPEDMIGEVDAVLIATDIGHEHVARARPFIEAGIPLFIDKPLTDNAEDLAQFKTWAKEGKAFISSSAMRFAKEFKPYHQDTYALGDLRLITMTMAKSWETYGIHALEAVYPILGPGFVSVQNIGEGPSQFVLLRHASGTEVMICQIYDLFGGFGLMSLIGTKSHVKLQATDTYQSFRDQLLSFVSYLRTGVEPVPFEETVELMRLVIAAQLSRAQGGAKILLKDLTE